ncbi:type II secretion system protein GspK [Alienimonas californiensis]|uniref:type II secretion system protein GspK n=1 Tax=Alienimonas californiensis TaxID=2527989 RepID=UPI00119DA3ED|nr:type II secretion system protein GspK [Alienimonas californiensis]
MTPISKLRRPAIARLGRRRTGSVLLAVLVLVLLLTFGVYGFTERMLAEKAAANAHGISARSRACADSGVALALALVDEGTAFPADPPPIYHEPAALRGVLVSPSDDPLGNGRFTVFAPVEGDPTGTQLRFGLIDESGKLDVNGLLNLTVRDQELTESQQRDLLMGLPGMTEAIADAIFDFIDEDDDLREFGAEFEDYAALNPPRSPRNGPIDSVDELLLVQGVTPALLYGEDANRNGLLDPGENDGEATYPPDNGDGLLDVGWTAYLTVHGGEPNLNADGEEKIDLNDGVLTDLFDALEEAFDTETAQFVVAYRLAGPLDPENSSDSLDPNADVDALLEEGLDEEGNPTVPTATEQEQVDAMAGALAGLIGGADEEATVTRAGMDLSGGATADIGSFYDLVDRDVDVEVDGELTTLISPFQSGALLDQLPTILQTVTTFDTEIIRGRVNVNQARVGALLGVPGMTQGLAESIDAARMIGADGEARPDLHAQRLTPFWLYTDGLADLPTLRRLDPFLTARGGFFRVRSIGYVEGGGPAVRVEAVIDGTTSPARVVEMRDLSDLGRGVPRAMLAAP